jgi:hypothetical protein
MTRFGWIVIAGFVAALGIALLLWGFARQSYVPTAEEGPAEAVDPATLTLYANGTYGFSFSYPASAVRDDDFTDGDTFPWRVNAIATGTPVVRFASGNAEARVGVSSDARALAGCAVPGPSERAADPLTTDTTTWQAFTFDELGTENERHATSYRQVYEGLCIAVEIFEPVSAAEPHADFGQIVRSFLFAR